MNHQKLRHYFLLVILLAMLVFVAWVFRPFLAPLVLAIVFAVVLQPVKHTLLRWTGNSSKITAVICLLLVAICFLVPLFFLGYQILTEAQDLYVSVVLSENRHYIESFLGAFGGKLNSFFPGAGNYLGSFFDNIDTYVRYVLEWVLQNIGTVFSNVAAIVLDLFIFFMALYYLLLDGGKARRMVINLSPLNDDDDELIFKRLRVSIDSVIRGNFFIALAQGLLTGIGFTIFGVPNGVLWGTVAGFASLIPTIGTAVVLLPAIVFLFFIGETFSAVGLVLWGALFVGLVDNFLGPYFMGRGMSLHPLLVLLAVLGGVAAFGPIGIFLGPLALSLFFGLLSVFSHMLKDHPESI